MKGAFTPDPRWGRSAQPGEGVPLEVRDGRIRAKLDPDAPARTPWFEDPAAGFRFVPAAGDAAVRDAVLLARGVVELDERRWRLEMQAVELRSRLDAAQQSLDREQVRARKLQGRLHAVESLHAEKERLVEDPQHVDDTEGTGLCAYCGNLWPCRTYQVAVGE